MSPAVVFMLALTVCSHLSPLTRNSCCWDSLRFVACVGRCLSSSLICSNCFWCLVIAVMYWVKDCLLNIRSVVSLGASGGSGIGCKKSGLGSSVSSINLALVLCPFIALE